MTSTKKEAFGRLYVLGGFALVRPSRASGADTDDMKAPLKREQGPARVAVVQDLDQASLNGTMDSPPEDNERQAIERGENEGMTLGRE